MKKFYKNGMTALFACFAMAAGAQTLDNATLLSPGAVALNLDDVVVTWGYQEIALVDEMEINGFVISATEITAEFEGTEYTAYIQLTDATPGGGFNANEDEYVENAISIAAWNDFPVASDGFSWQPGEYTLTIPAGVVCLASDLTVTNTEFTTVITVVKENYSSANVSPAIHGTYTPAQLSEVTLTWKNNGGDLCTLTPGSGNVTYQLVSSGETSVDGGNSAKMQVLESDKITIDGTKLILDFSGLTEYGTYDITVPAGFVIMNGNMIGTAVSITYNVTDKATMDEAMQLTPSKSEGTFMVFTYDENVTLNDDVNALFAINDYFMKDPQTIPASAVTIYSDAEMENAVEAGEVITIDLSDYLTVDDAENMVYVKLPEGLFVNAEGLVNPEQILSFEYTPDTTGINSINGENGVNEIYNLQGIKMNASQLPAGLYIINGKKVVIRK